jgi:molybdate transport system ATP-binding protein
MSLQKTIRVAFKGSLGRFDLDAAFTAPARGITALFGPSGCGKTTVLRAIAGLQHLADGYCAVDGDVWQDSASFRPTHRRPIGYVFQEASLFPHLSVRGNLLYGARGAGIADEQEEIDFDEVVDLLGLTKLLDRSPRNLSGGERQRVAVGRALLSRPKLLLMDEPLSALDRLTKEEILPFLERLHDRLSLPVLYVSHDLTEVERLADHLVLMEGGRVVAAGPLNELQSDPLLPLATARDAAVSLDAVVEGYDGTYGLMTLAVRGGRFLVPAPPDAIGNRHRLRIFAGDVSIARIPPQASTILNDLPARIMSTTRIGEHEIVVVLGLGPDGTGERLLARVTQRSWDQLDLAEEMLVHAQVKGVALVQRPIRDQRPILEAPELRQARR